MNRLNLTLLCLALLWASVSTGQAQCQPDERTEIVSASRVVINGVEMSQQPIVLEYCGGDTVLLQGVVIYPPTSTSKTTQPIAVSEETYSRHDFLTQLRLQNQHLLNLRTDCAGRQSALIDFCLASNLVEWARVEDDGVLIKFRGGTTPAEQMPMLFQTCSRTSSSDVHSKNARTQYELLLTLLTRGSDVFLWDTGSFTIPVGDPRKAQAWDEFALAQARSQPISGETWKNMLLPAALAERIRRQAANQED